MRYRLSHRTSYTYKSSVDLAHHLAHLRVREFPGQHVIATEILTDPRPVMVSHRIDHFGNHIDLYRIETPHMRFAIEGRADVEVKFPEPPPFSTTPRWEDIRDGLRRYGFPIWIEASEFVHDSALIPIDSAIGAYGAQSFTPGRPILEAARELTSRINADFVYKPGATDISTPLAEVFAGRKLETDRGAACLRALLQYDRVRIDLAAEVDRPVALVDPGETKDVGIVFGLSHRVGRLVDGVGNLLHSDHALAPFMR